MPVLTQIEAQMLALAVQRFYLPADTPTSRDAFKLLEAFHTAPDTFDYQQLIEASPQI